MRKFLSDILVKASLGVEQNAYVLGTVGIGTSTPSYKLHVAGDVLSSGSFRLESGGATVTYISEGWGINLNGDSTHPVQVPNASLAVGYALGGGVNYGSGNMFVSGNVGIGTNNPGYKLDITGVTRFQDKVRFAINTWNLSDDGYNRLYFANGGRTYYGSGDGHEWRNASDSPIAFLSNSGNLGIGTSSPISKLDIRGSHTSGYGIVNIVSTDSAFISIDSQASDGGLRLKYNTGDRWIIGIRGNDKLQFNNASDQPKIVIQQDGNVGIGTTSPVAKLDVNGETLFRNRITINNTAPQTYAQLNVWDTTTGNGASRIADFTNGTDNNLNIYISQVGASSKYSELASYSSNPLVLNSTTGGNVGIGTVSPSYKLDVNGTTRIRGNVDITTSGGTNVLLAYSSYVQAWQSFYVSQGGGAHNFAVSNASSGGNAYFNNVNVGIGTSSPYSNVTLQYTGNNLAGSYFGNLVLNATTNDTWNRLRFDRGGVARFGVALSPQEKFVISNLYTNGTTNNPDDAAFVIAQNSNVGIGTASPNDKLSVVGNVSVTSGDYRIYNGSTILSSASTSLLEINAGGFSNVSITNGNVGIGTTSPSAKLHVAGSTLIDNYLYLDSNEIWSKNGGDLFVKADNKVYIQPAASTTAVFDTNGNVGIGTTNPTLGLHIADGKGLLVGPSGASGSMYVSPSDENTINGSYGIASDNADIWLNYRGYQDGFSYFRDTRIGNGKGTTILMVDGSEGNVGIGTTSPAAKLEVYGGNLSLKLPTYAGSARYGFGNPARIDDAAYIEYNGVGDFTGSLIFATNGSTSNVSATEKMRIAANGNVGIGTTSPSEALSISGSSTSGVGISLANGDGIGGRILADNSSLYFYSNNGTLVYSLNNSKIRLNDGGGGTIGIELGSNGSISQNGNGGGLTFSDTTAYLSNGLIVTAGNVGIGTTSPAQQLHVTQNIALGLTGGSAGDTNNILFPTVNGTHTYAPNGIFYTKKGNWGGQIDIRTSYDWGYATDNAKISLNGAEGNGITFSTGASALGSTERVRITSVGNVGIGTTSPASKLHVEGNISAGLGYNGGFYANANSSTVDENWGFDFSKSPSIADYSTRVKFYSSTGSSIKLGFWDSRTSSYVGYFDGGVSVPNFIIPNGNVGIGTTSPTSKLDVWGDLSIANSSYYSAAYDWNFSQSSSNGRLAIAYYGSEKMSILDNGNVGIGTTAPAKILDIAIPNATHAQYGIRLNSPGGYGGASLYHDYGQGNGVTVFKIANDYGDARINLVQDAYDGTGSPSSIRFFTAPFGGGDIGVERVRFASDGNVGIGTTVPNHQLSVYAGGSRTATTAINAGNSNTIPAIAIQSGGDAWASATNGFAFYYNSTNGNLDLYRKEGAVTTEHQVMTWVRTNGNVGIGTTSPTAKLHIYGAGSTELRIGSSTANTNSLLSFYEASLASWGIEAGQANGPFYIKDLYNSATRLTINASGNVGIGTTSPNDLLTLQRNDGRLRFNTSAGTRVLYLGDDFGSGGFQQIYDSTGAVKVQFSAGVSYFNGDNVGIGTNNPGAKLEVDGSFNIKNGDGNITHFNYVDGSTNYVRGTTYFDTAPVYFTGGNVGIGTTSPSYKLQVAGSFQAGQGYGTFTVGGGTDWAYNITGNEAAVLLAANIQATTRSIYNYTVPAFSSNLIFGTSYGYDIGESYNIVTFSSLNINVNKYTNAAHFASNGNVGIGTTSPASKLHVVETSNSATTYPLIVNNQNNQAGDGWGAGIKFSTSNPLGGGNEGLKWSSIQAFDVNNYGSSSGLSFTVSETYNKNTAMVINRYGGVGIGTTSPGEKLEVAGGTIVIGNNQFYRGRYNGGTPQDLIGMSSGNVIRVGDFTSSWNIDLGGTSAIRFLLQNSEVARFTSTGLGIGTSSPGYKLDVAGLSGDWATRFASNAGASAYFAHGGGYGAYIDAGSNATSATYLMSLVSNGSTRVYVRGDGVVGIGTGSPSLESAGLGLDIFGDSYTQLRVRSGSTSAGIEFKPGSGKRWEIQANTSSKWFVYDRTDQLYRLLIDTDGNVGIGTTSPSAFLDISTGTATDILRFGASSRWGFRRENNDNRYVSFYRGLSSTPSAVWTVDGDNGNVGIGTTSPNYKLHVSGNAYINETLFVNQLTTIEDSLIVYDNVGIGTTSPNQKLQVNGFVNATGYVNSGTTFIKSFNIGNISAGATFALGRLNFESVYTHHFRVTITSYYGSKTFDFIGYQTYLNKTVSGISGGGDVVIETILDAYTQVVGVKIGITTGVNDYVYTATVECLSTFSSWQDYSSTTTITPTSIGYTNSAFAIGGGNVGIGTTSPGYKLDVATGNDNAIRILNSLGSNNNGFALAVGSGTPWLDFYGGRFDIKYNTSPGSWNSGSNIFLSILSSGNVGIGTTSPTGELHIYGSQPAFRIQSSVSGNMQFGQWDTVTNRIQSTGRNFYLVGTDSYDTIFATNGSERMRITSAGNVGIGTTSPGTTLDVAGTFRVTGSASTLGTFESSNSSVFIGLKDSSGDFVYLGNDDGDFLVQTPTSGYSTKLIIKDNGNVGIGTTNPASPGGFTKTVHINGGYASLVLTSTIPNKTWEIGVNSSSLLTFYDGVADRMVINNSGNVGIGTISPAYKTQISLAAGTSTSISTIASSNYNLVVQNTTDVAGTYAGIGFMNPFDTQGYIGVSQVGTGFGSGGNMLFALRPQGGGTVMTEYMRITSTGNVGIGTGSPAARLDVSGSGSVLQITDSSTSRNFTFTPSYATGTYGGFFNHSTGNITLGASLGTDNGSTVGIILGAPSGTRTALLQVKGTGSTSATTALLVQNSNGTSKLKIDDGLNGDFIMYSNQKINGDGIIIQSTNGSTQTPSLTLKPLSSAGQGRIWADSDRFYLGMTNTNGVNSNNVYLFTIDNRISKFAVTPDGSVTDASFYGKAIWNGGAAMTLRASSAGQSARIFNVENFDGSTNYFNVGATGNVGIGTTSPQSKLHVEGNTQLYAGTLGSSPRLIFGSETSSTDKSIYLDSYYMVFQGHNNEGFKFVTTDAGGTVYNRMIVKGDGNVGIGTTSPSEKLEVNGSIRLSDGNADGPQLKLASSGYSDWNIDNYSGSLRAYYGGTEYTRLTSSGNFGIGTSSPSYKLHVEGNVSGISIYASHDIAAFSDITVKKDVEKIENAVDKVKELNGYTYVRTDDETGTRRAGVIAQEVQKVLPEVVSANPDGTLNVAYSNMVALLIEAVKEQQKEIDELKRMLNK